MDVSSARHLIHRRLIRKSGEDDSRKPFFLVFSSEKRIPYPLFVGALSAMPVRKSGLGILNKVTSAQYKYIRSTRGSAKMIQAVMGGEEFYNYYHLRTLSKKRSDGKKAPEVAYKSRLNILVSDIKGTDKRLLIHPKITGTWLSVHGTTRFPTG